jgi:hypothetical protein
MYKSMSRSSSASRYRRAGPQSFCLVPYNPAWAFEFSPLASGAEQDSPARSRTEIALPDGCVQRKSAQAHPAAFLIAGRAHKAGDLLGRYAEQAFLSQRSMPVKISRWFVIRSKRYPPLPMTSILRSSPSFRGTARRGKSRGPREGTDDAPADHAVPGAASQGSADATRSPNEASGCILGVQFLDDGGSTA